MAIKLTPPPTRLRDTNEFAWTAWFNNVTRVLTYTGSLAWSLLDFTGSNLTDIVTRLHNDLQTKQGGTTGEYYHLTANEWNSSRGTTVSVAVDTSLDDTNHTVLVTATGKIMTLPAASTARIGLTWTVVLGTTGYVDVKVSGSDTFYLPTTDTTIRLTAKGTSVSLRCLTATSWSIV